MPFRFNLNLLKNVYFLMLSALLILMIATPFLINEKMISELSDDMLETIVLLTMVITGFIIYRLYRRELEKNQKSLDELLGHVGSVNIQIEQIKAFFCDLKKYPESKKDLKYILHTFADRVLAMVNADWVLFRIIEIDSAHTLSEHGQSRGNSAWSNHEIGNKDLLETGASNGFISIQSSQDNFNLKVFCVLPKKSLSEEQKILLGKIVNDLGMLYLIFSSVYYKNVRARK